MGIELDGHQVRRLSRNAAHSVAVAVISYESFFRSLDLFRGVFYKSRLFFAFLQ
jgi:hypothetical protein